MSCHPHCLWIGIWLLACLLQPTALAAEDERLQHWAWQALQDPPGAAPPSIDAFVHKRLAKRGLEMSPAADRRTLIRRLSFDLHGLPPSPEAVRAFEADDDPKAYEQLVDQMLASPHFGERFAQHWLDIAHYADTHGFERDRRRPNAWPYRDYVIAAFNDDKPYNRFLQEQIAGDVLWSEDGNAVIATGFLAAGPWDFVGQVETKSPLLRRAARSLDLDDMATQVMTSTMAMTVNCARCHDHKLDPISQREYYQLRAVFAGVKRDDRRFHAGSGARLQAERSGLLQEINRLEPGRDLADIVGGGDGTGNGKAGQGIDARSAKVETRRMGYLTNFEPNRFARSKNPFVDGVVIPNGGEEVAVPISSTGMTISLPKGDGKAWDIVRNGPVNSQHSPKLSGIDFSKGPDSLLGLHANAAITFAISNFRATMDAEELRFTAQLGYFGKQSDQSHADAWVFLDGKKVAAFRRLKRADGLKNIDIPLHKGAQFLTLVSTDGGNGISMDQVGFGNAVIRLAAAGLSADDRARVAKLRARVGAIDAEIAALGSGVVYSIVPQGDRPTDVRVMQRGDPETEVGQALAPGAMSVLAMLEPDLGDEKSTESKRRAALARWITDSRNPLTPRVIVNRLWHWHFGQGLVDTPSDFGLGGGRPSHPDLLDWLALELQRHDWSLKAIHRKILLSDSYQQDSRYAGDAKGVGVDADNRLLWRQNPRRIEAEAIRDSVLSVSGKLNRARGGPGYEDFKYKEAYAPEYTYITADTPDLWKRSIYRYVVRTTPDQFLTTLDCPDPANLTPKRMTTTTPLQSLALYNNDFMLRQARYFAERIEAEAGAGVPLQVAHAFQLAFGRRPSATEGELGAKLVEEQSLFALCRSLFNANEFIYVD